MIAKNTRLYAKSDGEVKALYDKQIAEDLKMKRTDEALELLEIAPDSVRSDAIYFYNKGCYQAAIGDLDTAFDCIKKSFDLDESLIEVARRDPDLAILKDSI